MAPIVCIKTPNANRRIGILLNRVGYITARWPEGCRFIPRGFLNCVNSVFNIIGSNIIAVMRMIIRVVAELAAEFNHTLGAFFIALMLKTVADYKKGCRAVILLQCVENDARCGFIRPVIKRKRNHWLVWIKICSDIIRSLNNRYLACCRFSVKCGGRYICRAVSNGNYLVTLCLCNGIVIRCIGDICRCTARRKHRCQFKLFACKNISVFLRERDAFRGILNSYRARR